MDEKYRLSLEDDEWFRSLSPQEKLVVFKVLHWQKDDKLAAARKALKAVNQALEPKFIQEAKAAQKKPGLFSRIKHNFSVFFEYLGNHRPGEGLDERKQ